jgi:hypothetical protein
VLSKSRAMHRIASLSCRIASKVQDYVATAKIVQKGICDIQKCPIRLGSGRY